MPKGRACWCQRADLDSLEPDLAARNGGAQLAGADRAARGRAVGRAGTGGAPARAGPSGPAHSLPDGSDRPPLPRGLRAVGERRSWLEGDHLPLPRAVERLRTNDPLESPAARRALARVLQEAAGSRASLAPALARRLRTCEVDGAWGGEVTVAELLGAPIPA